MYPEELHRSHINLLHSTCSSIYWVLISDVLNIKNKWMVLMGLTLIHYVITVSSTNYMGYTLLLLFIISVVYKVLVYRPKKQSVIEASSIVDGLRLIVSSLVAISIFSCDFLIYPPWKMKSKYFGMSLMDLGVVVYMVNAGMIYSRSHKLRIRKQMYILLMGCIRLGVLSSGYHSDPTEYGTHLNFYFVYSAADVLSVLFRGIHPLYASIGFFLLHEGLLLRRGVVEYIFFGERKGFFSGNREGLLSIIPYLGVLFLGKYFGTLLFKKEKNIKKSVSFFFIFLCLLGIHIISGMYLPASRRLCSLSFTSFSCGTIALPISIYYLLGHLGVAPDIRETRSASYLMGPIFLLSNFYVLIGNILFNWKSVSQVSAHVINCIYIFILFIGPLYIYEKTRGNASTPRNTTHSTSRNVPHAVVRDTVRGVKSA
ncbi:glucosaminylphosphatidylinositol acyltransferase [Nematocida sp. LUAm3]|nr:glucosaminylphosphatidylinositol acyltransferase [Nematocida sp. LUAm3]KAI5173871.1 glucosaminylphosphatidylinositol acyltransferase [Nematocida sp. LUAm2]KAI5177384.1 glucosaminylphosphatidylinositol acyltransferase [Nematocida sp. LUAm1]